MLLVIKEYYAILRESVEADLKSGNPTLQPGKEFVGGFWDPVEEDLLIGQP